VVDDVWITPTRAQLERLLAAHLRAAATHRRASLVHEEAAAHAREAGDEARALRELRLAAQQTEGALIEDSRAEQNAVKLAALDATPHAAVEGSV
jgi:hypothetical protein